VVVVSYGVVVVVVVVEVVVVIATAVVIGAPLEKLELPIFLDASL